MCCDCGVVYMSRQARILARDAIETSMSPEGGARKAVDGCEVEADSIANGVLGDFDVWEWGWEWEWE